ncbi:MAG: copper-containing nitrite reductase [Salaquimonas sp.]|nr:copper-containing nitrite reductase [Salaquimonas sp.]
MSRSEKAFEPARRAFLKTAGFAGAVGGTVLAGSAMAMPAVEGRVTGAAAPARPLVKAAATTTDISSLPRVKQKLVNPPFLPEHEQVATTGPKIVEVELTVEEKKIEIDDDGTEIWAYAYNGSVPGPMIVVHEGDYVELTLRNPDTNLLEHNIDFHAATGALGSGALTKVNPGEQVKVRWKAVKPGVFIYHCAPGDIMIPYHVVHGMNGAIMVLPRDGLKDAQGNPYRYDRAYYVGEQDFYVPRDENGDYKSYEGAADDMSDMLDVMRTLTPSHVVFNGAVGALTGDNALKAKVGEKVLFIHSQANRDTRPHLIGGHGDLVWETGSFADTPATGLETWYIRGGSAGAMAYEFRQPGLYAYLNHNLIEAVMLGATAHVMVDGEWNDDLMTQLTKPGPINA